MTLSNSNIEKLHSMKKSSSKKELQRLIETDVVDTYNGENAVSFAVGVPVGERAFFSASIAADSGSYGESGGVGLTFQLPK
jgi:hypothetical protein